MLATVDDGAMSVVICTGHGTRTILIGADGAPVPVKSDRNTTICPFAATGAITLADHAPCRLESEAHYADLTYPSVIEPNCASRRFTAASARGPPFLQS